MACAPKKSKKNHDGKPAVSKLEIILKDKNVTKQTKIKISQTLVFPIVTYGSKSWTMRKKDRKKNLMLLNYGGKF